MKTIAVLIMGLWAASWAEAQEPVATADQMLPLAVGNSWGYSHGYFNFLTDDPTGDFFGQDITIRVTHTEEIEGHTYYVFSPMPYEDPPVLFFFLAGQKVRFDGNNLVFRGREGDIALYQFKPGGHSYSIPETESDTLVVSQGWSSFQFRGHEESIPESFFREPSYGMYYYEWRSVSFIRGLGLSRFIVDGMEVYGDTQATTNDQYHMSNHLRLHSATINGVELDVKTFRYPYTVIRETSWGSVKRAFSPSRRG